MTHRLQTDLRKAAKERDAAASSALIIEGRDGERRIVPLSGEEIVVGRAGQGTTVRLHERDVSRRHARFSRSNGSVWIEDLGSSNGTRVNGERIQGKRRIREGDLVQIGGYDIAVLGAPGLGQGPEDRHSPGKQPAPPVADVPTATPALAAGSEAAACPPATRSRERHGTADGRHAPRAGGVGALIAIGAASLVLGWAAGRLLRPALHPRGTAAAQEVRR